MQGIHSLCFMTNPLLGIIIFFFSVRMYILLDKPITQYVSSLGNTLLLSLKRTFTYMVYYILFNVIGSIIFTKIAQYITFHKIATIKNIPDKTSGEIGQYGENLSCFGEHI